MMEQVIIRNETEGDYREVEELTRRAFWNLYIPGCHEHYVAHKIRGHEDFIPELDLVVEKDHRIIGNIMYTKSRLTDQTGEEKEILTFGPVSVLPEYQRKGYGKTLIEASFQKAAALGYDVVVIFGNPANYVGRGFKSCKKYNVCAGNGQFPVAMLVKELKEGALDGRKWVYQESPAFEIDEREACEFDEGFEKWEKKYEASQEEFYIYSHSIIVENF